MSRNKVAMLLALLLTILTVAVASAVPPTIIRFYADPGSIPLDVCDFPVEYTYEGPFVNKLFYDQNGSLIKVQIEGHAVTSVYHADYSEDALTGVLNGIVQIDLRTGETHLAGLDWNITVPGEGIVYLNAGHGVRDVEGNLIFDAGPVAADYEHMLCGALAP